jgi:surfactin synthase thioesterase subunit
MSTTKLVAGGWLLREPDRAAAVRIFCFPYLGAGASMFYAWPTAIDRVNLCPLQPPGRESRIRESSHEDYASLAADMIDALAPYLDQPFAFFSHCNTVYVLYEAVRQLADSGLNLPIRLIASSIVPPSRMPFGTILDLPEHMFGDIVAGFMIARGLEPDPELVELALDAFTADFRAYRAYDPDTSPLPCHVTALAWTDDTNVRPDQVADWRQVADTDIRTLDGDHWAFLSCPDALRGVFAEVLGSVDA